MAKPSNYLLISMTIQRIWPVPFQIANQTPTLTNLRNVLTEKIYCCQGLIQYGFEDEVCSFHECLETPIDHSFYAEEVDDYLWHHANEAIVEEKNESFYPKKFTAFNKTFFEVGI